jgi:large subunit ribosomal protein L4
MEKETKVLKKNTEGTKEKPAKSGLTIDVLDFAGKVSGSLELSKEIFGVKPNKSLLSQAVRVYLANQRLGNAQTKTRAQVAGGGRKPWRQKGTGRARIGSIRAPHWRGGGVVHGPQMRDYSLDFPKKMKKAALISALSSKLGEKNLLVLNKLDFKEAKTKEAATLVKNLQIKGKITMVAEKIEEKESRALKNLKDTKLINVLDLNTYEVLNNKKLLLTKSAIVKLQERLLGSK